MPSRLNFFMKPLLSGFKFFKNAQYKKLIEGSWLSNKNSNDYKKNIYEKKSLTGNFDKFMGVNKMAAIFTDRDAKKLFSTQQEIMLRLDGCITKKT